MQDNLEAVISVLQFIYDNIMYAELNTKSDYCQVCGYDGEIKIVEDDGKLVWECPKCGNRDQNKLNVARRTCGYIGTQFWNQGRTQEIKDRVLHLLFLHKGKRPRPLSQNLAVLPAPPKWEPLAVRQTLPICQGLSLWERWHRR